MEASTVSKYNRNKTSTRKYSNLAKKYQAPIYRAPKYKSKNQVYLFKRHGTLADLVVGNVTPTYTGYGFRLTDVPNNSEFTALFDMYKINCIKIRFLPQMTENISLTSVNNPYANIRFLSAIDKNDSTVTSSDQIREYQSCKVTPILKEHERIIYKPQIFDSSGYSVSPWLATSSPSTVYYGLKTSVDPIVSSSITVMHYSVEVVYYLAFKNVK